MTVTTPAGFRAAGVAAGLKASGGTDVALVVNDGPRFAAAGVFGTLGYFFITWSYRLLDISALQPITFLGIVWAALMDVAVWGKTSDLWTFVGAAIIVAPTSYIAHREAVAGGKKA